MPPRDDSPPESRVPTFTRRGRARPGRRPRANRDRPPRHAEAVTEDPAARPARSREEQPLRVEGHDLVTVANDEGPVDRLTDRGPPGAHGLDDVVALGEDPRRRRSREPVMTRLVEVAAADGHGLGGEQPPGQRCSPRRHLGPRGVPHLGHRRTIDRQQPRAVRGERMVDRQHAAPTLGLLGPGFRRAPEVDEADVAQDVGVTDVPRHLLPRDEHDAVPAPGLREVGVMARRVVVGDGQEVEPP